MSMREYVQNFALEPGELHWPSPQYNSLTLIAFLTIKNTICLWHNKYTTRNSHVLFDRKYWSLYVCSCAGASETLLLKQWGYSEIERTMPPWHNYFLIYHSRGNIEVICKPTLLVKVSEEVQVHHHTFPSTPCNHHSMYKLCDISYHSLLYDRWSQPIQAICELYTRNDILKGFQKFSLLAGGTWIGDSGFSLSVLSDKVLNKSSILCVQHTF